MDDLIEKLQGGCVYRPKRWSGDTHDDLGGPIDEAATESLLAEAAAALSQQRAVPEGVLVWVRNKRTLLSARMSAGEFHAQEALDMAMLSRLEVFLAAPSPEQEE